MIYAVIAVYFGLLLWLGILASRRVKSISDYYVGGKQVGYWVAAFSARAASLRGSLGPPLGARFRPCIL